MALILSAKYVEGLDRITSKVQRRILHLLSDGNPHQFEELRSCLWDELGGRNAVHSQVYRLRLLLQETGLEVLCEIRNRQSFYRLVKSVVLTDLCE